MAFAQLSKARLEYVSAGEGPRRVLFLHGFQASARIWHAVQAAMPSDEYSTIAIHNRGAGGSDAPADEAAYGCEVFASDAYDLVRQLGWTSFTLVGHSMGGATAMQLAVDHPTLLEGLFLLDPAGPDGRTFPVGGPSLEDIIDRSMAARRKSLQSNAVLDGIGTPPGGDVLPEWKQLLAADMRAAPEQRLRGSMRSMFSLRLGERLKDLPMPVMLAAGDRDELIPLAEMLATWAKLPTGSGLQIWHGVGHSPNVDCPEAVAAVLQQFIEGLVTAADEDLE